MDAAALLDVYGLPGRELQPSAGGREAPRLLSYCEEALPEDTVAASPLEMARRGQKRGRAQGDEEGAARGAPLRSLQDALDEYAAALALGAALRADHASRRQEHSAAAGQEPWTAQVPVEIPLGYCSVGEIVALSGPHPHDFPSVVPAADDDSAAYGECSVVPDAEAQAPGDEMAVDDFSELMSDAADSFYLSDPAYYGATAEDDRGGAEVHGVVMPEPIDQEYYLTALFAEPIDELQLHDLPDDSAVYGECGISPDAAAQCPGDQMALEDFLEHMPGQESDLTPLFPEALREYCDRIRDDSTERAVLQKLQDLAFNAPAGTGHRQPAKEHDSMYKILLEYQQQFETKTMAETDPPACNELLQ